MPIIKLGFEQCRIKLLGLAALANAGNPSIISRNGKPYATLMSAQALEKATARPQQPCVISGIARKKQSGVYCPESDLLKAIAA